MKKIVCLGMALLSFQVFGMKKNICFNVQTSAPLQLIADIVPSEDSPVKLLGKKRVEETSLPITDDAFRVVLNQDSFEPCTIAIKNYVTDKKLVDVVIERTHQDSPPKIRLSNQMPGLKYALYRPMAGGGIRFVLAIGETDSDVSMQAVKSRQGRIDRKSVV